MENKLIVGLMALLIAAFVILSTIVIVGINNQASKDDVKIVVPTAQEIASLVVIPAPVITNVATESNQSPTNVDASKIDKIYEKINGADDDLILQNDTAKTLVLAEINKRAFLKEIVEVLNDNSIENQSVEDYKSITSLYSIVVKDVEIDDDDNAVVTVEVKVKFINDEDEELAYRAKFTAVYDVTDLDVDDFSDAEAVLDTLDVTRIYEN
jgi:hypothetical protein